MPSSAFNYHYCYFTLRSSSARIEKLYQAAIIVVVVIISFCTFVAWELFAVVLFFFCFIALAFAVGFYALKLSPRLTPETQLYGVIIIIVIATVVVAGQQKKQLSDCRRAKTRYSSGSKSCRGGKYLVTT